MLNLLFGYRPYILRDPGEGGGGDGGDGDDDNKDGAGKEEEFMPNQHSEGEAGDDITVKRSEYNDLHGFRKGFGKDYEFNEEDHKTRSGIDLEDHKSMKDFVDAVETNPKIYDVVKEMLAAKREDREPDLSAFSKKQLKDASDAVNKAGDGDGDNKGDKNKDGANDESSDRLKALEEKDQKNEEDKLETEFNTNVDTALKDLKFYSEREKSALIDAVKNEFINNDKLMLDDVAKVVAEQYKEVQAYRKDVLTSHNKKLIAGERDDPDAGSGAGASSPGKKYDPSKATSSERVNKFSEELKEALS